MIEEYKGDHIQKGNLIKLLISGSKQGGVVAVGSHGVWSDLVSLGFHLVFGREAEKFHKQL